MDARTPPAALDTSAQKLEARINRSLRAEGVARQRWSAIGTSAALLVIAPLLVFLTGWPEALYYQAILVAFIALLWLQYYIAKLTESGLQDYLMVPLYFGLLAFTLIYPSPFSDAAQYEFTASIGLRTGTFIYFFLVLTSFAFSFSPGLVLWCGVCGCVSWAVGTAWVIARPGIEIVSEPEMTGDLDAFARAIEATQHPRFVDLEVTVQSIVGFALVSVLLAMVVAGSRQLLLRRAAEERRGANLARYLPAPLAARMAEADTPFLQDRETEAAVVFTDIVGFSRWAETRSPAQVVRMLREVHALVAEEVFAAEGVLDKYIGDGAMATFGIANADAPAARALTCVEAITARMVTFNAERAARGEEPIHLSVGAHIGRVTVGDVGVEGRLEMAVLGDAVNVASRLEALTRALDARAAVSDALITAAGGARPGWVMRGAQMLPGRAGAVPVWVLARQDADGP